MLRKFFALFFFVTVVASMVTPVQANSPASAHINFYGEEIYLELGEPTNVTLTCHDYGLPTPYSYDVRDWDGKPTVIRNMSFQGICIPGAEVSYENVDILEVTPVPQIMAGSVVEFDDWQPAIITIPASKKPIRFTVQTDEEEVSFETVPSVFEYSFPMYDFKGMSKGARGGAHKVALFTGKELRLYGPSVVVCNRPCAVLSTGTYSNVPEKYVSIDLHEYAKGGNPGVEWTWGGTIVAPLNEACRLQAEALVLRKLNESPDFRVWFVFDNQGRFGLAGSYSSRILKLSEEINCN